MAGGYDILQNLVNAKTLFMQTLSVSPFRLTPLPKGGHAPSLGELAKIFDF